MKLKIKQIRALFQALVALDGNQSTKIVNDKEVTVTEHYKFGSTMTWNKVKNTRLLRAKVEEIDEAAKQLLRKHSGGKEELNGNENPDAFKAFTKEFEALLETEEEIVGLAMFKQEDFNLYDKVENPEGNNIPTNVLEQLWPLIND